MKMNYHRGDKLSNRYLSSDAFTSLKNKLGGRSITSLGGNRKRNSYRIANQGFDLLEYKTFIYRTFIFLFLLVILVYIIPQTRYLIHGFTAEKFSNTVNVNQLYEENNSYDVAPLFLKTDYFSAKQKDVYVDSNLLVYDFITDNIIGLTENNSSSTVNIRLLSDSGFKNDLLIEQKNIVEDAVKPEETNASTSSTTEPLVSEIVKEDNTTYKSYVFEGMGYGQMIAKVPPKTEIKKDSFVYIRTVNGLKPVAKIINIDTDNKSTFIVVYAQLIVAPQNIYKVLIK